MASFNIDGGYLEGLCRGFKCGILKQADYLNLVQCETLEGLYTYDMLQHFFSLICMTFHVIHRKEKKTFTPITHKNNRKIQ